MIPPFPGQTFRVGNIINEIDGQMDLSLVDGVDDVQKLISVFEILAGRRVADLELPRVIEAAPHGLEQRVVNGNEVWLPSGFRGVVS